MGKTVLPCPVCGGESFIESVTQGGLICTDCGSVSNQVEVADDEDTQIGTKVFARSMNYVPVTEEESRLKRERRKHVTMHDGRDQQTLLHGLGLVLAHMVDSCVLHNLCHSRAKDSVRQTWFEFLKAVSMHTNEPCILNNSARNKLKAGMARWGFPEADEIVELVSKDLPEGHAKRGRALIQMLEDRGIEHREIRLFRDSQLLIYAHDWLCLLLAIETFPIPDDLLLRLGENPGKLTWDSIREIKNRKGGISKEPLSNLRRRGIIRRVFSSLVTNESVRCSYMSSLGRHGGSGRKGNVPDIDMRTLLAILIVGIRNGEGGVESVHVLNWIARCQLPFFSAHKCLPGSVDRIEYYRVSRMNQGYKRSLFAASYAPTAKELEDIIEKIQLMGVPSKPNHPLELAQSCLDMLGLSPLKDLTCTIISGVLDAMLDGLPSPFMAGRVYRKISSLRPCEPFPIFSDIQTCDLVLAAIVVASKLVFPGLHDSLRSDEPVANAIDFCPSPLRYAVVSRRSFAGDIGDVEWWSKCLSEPEQRQFLKFAEDEMLNELRESLAQDILDQLVTNNTQSSECCLFAQKETEQEDLLISGKVDRYQMCEGKMDTDSVLFSFVQDLQFACNSSSKIDALFKTISHLEHFIFENRLLFK